MRMSSGFGSKRGGAVRFNISRAGAVTAFCLGLALLPGFGFAAEDSSNTPPAVAESTLSEDTLRSYLRLQDQLHEVQQRLESTRKDAELSAARNAELLAGRMAALEQSLAQQRAREFEIMQSSNRMMLLAAGIFAAVCLGAAGMMGYFQWRTIHRLSEIATVSPSRLLGAGTVGDFGVSDQLPAVPSAVDRANLRLSGVLQQLEKRILELEHTSHPAQPSRPSPVVEVNPARTGTNGQPTSGQPVDEAVESRVPFLVGRGQAMLNMNKPEEALAAFEEALSLQPDDAEALVKRGQAQEQLGRIDEALQSYDRAIAIDASLTVAYLCKGGLFNRMDKHAEALDCYEKALRGQR